MAKMVGLIENEFIKTFKKLSTKILCILIVLVCIGLGGIAKFSEKVNEDYVDDYEYNDTIDYDYEINQLKEVQTYGYEVDIERLEFMKANNITWLSWRRNACFKMFSYTYDEKTGTTEYDYTQEQRDEFKKIIEENDWKKYCQFILDNKEESEISAGTVWEYTYRLENNVPLPDTFDDYYDWKNTVIDEVSSAKTIIASGEEEDDINEWEKTEQIGLYKLEHNVSYNVAECVSTDGGVEYNCWMVLGTSVSLVMIVGLFIMVVAGSIVSNEYSQGTIKFLIINPVKRWKILMAKYITCILTGVGFVLLFYVGSVIASGLFFGFSDMSMPYISYTNGKIVASSGLGYIFKCYLLKCVNIVVMATLAFAISSLIRSSSLAIGVSVFALLAGNSLVLVLAEFKLDWARYLIFANTDLLTISKGGSTFQNHSLGFAIGVIVAHMVVFLLTAWDGFTKREI